MPHSGPAIYRQLLLAYQTVQADLEKLRGHVAAEGAESERLDQDRQATLASLAEHYLPELSEQAIEGTWHEVRSDMRQVLLRQQEHTARLQLQLGDLEHNQQQQETALERADEQLDQLQQRQQELSQQLLDRLTGDQRFSELAKQAAAAEAALEQAEGRLAEVQEDAAQKLPAYQQSSLFQYLYRRGLGTPAYQSRGFARRMDRWVGKLIGYQRARQSYEFLRDTPKHMEKVIDEDRRHLETVMQELERQRDARAREIGLPAVSAQVETAEAERNAVVERLDELSQRADALRTELLDVEDSRGVYYGQAVELFRGMLQDMDQQTLAQRAEKTPQIRDDQIVARLQGIDVEAEQLEQQYRQRRDRLKALNDQLREIGRLLQRFRAAGYESRRSQFQPSLDIAGALDSFRQGHSTIESVWLQLRRAQSFGPASLGPVSQAAGHPLTQTLTHAMATAAGSALSEHARRASHRGRNKLG